MWRVSGVTDHGANNRGVTMRFSMTSWRDGVNYYWASVAFGHKLRTLSWQRRSKAGAYLSGGGNSVTTKICRELSSVVLSICWVTTGLEEFLQHVLVLTLILIEV